MERLPLWLRALIQCFLATAALASVLSLLERDYSVVVASIGATAFIVFATPRSISARARNVLGGHMIGFLAGGIWWLVPQAILLAKEFVYSGAVGTAMLLMVLCRVHHPPAAGTALGVVLAGFSVGAAFTVLTAISAMIIIERSLREFLVDLV
ncbi:MAG: HPP family protein [Verrucomicrobiota bacterium]